jgi:hypothetical protein
MKDNGEIKGKGEAVLPNEDIRKAEVKGWRNDDRICLVWQVEEEDEDDEDYLRFGFAGLVGENDNELIGSYYPLNLKEEAKNLGFTSYIPDVEEESKENQ